MVLKMLAAMEQTPNSSRDPVEDFLTTGRTGRRNAMADILGEHAATGSGDLSERMEGLSTDQMGPGPSTSGAGGQGDAQKAGAPPAAGAGATKEAGR